ncbi:MAG: hypothetical protein A2271_01030 [Candidatus Moranbacteria bacterium RIFOXYA12_FULL_35_19]|nr:MAG: Transposase [Candidatus Moranbacteria bacterium GW2011_GWF2_35_39]OGI32602.1 MAG: hypothetical protein A2489_02745 [Candidatus Moranbacteria bacterium RIFOXYC12_FULL_36_13]OGI32887.1 MAG: hypothetical protein A2343_02320 [Candidatus Moranbacteria bacterium RIFOXYB12_FULL_35_8]OGI36483.1 MAG: hypothetical protein A2271_01030 [Candidatus Moranbacteria bacterium RIFOXYA12_FULL_35_19]
MRKTEFANGEFYHIYNRGVDKREVFSDKFDYERFLKSMKEFNRIEPIGSLYEKYLREKKGKSENGGSTSLAKKWTSNVHNGHLMSISSPQLIDVICYCLNSNHYHFILKQLQEKGIEKFMQKIGNGYTKYFNNKYKRSGVLFQGVFKSIHIDSNGYLLYLSAYVNKNNFIHGYNNSNWKYSSLAEYEKENDQENKLCNTVPILEQFKDKKDYMEFLNDNALYLKDKKEEGKYLLEENS